MRARILYIDREDDDGLRLGIIENLRTDYEIDDLVGLTYRAVHLVRRAESDRPFEAVITHIPPWAVDDKLKPYEESLDIITEIVRSTEAPVIAYTAAAGWRELGLIAMHADIVVEKSTFEQDIAALREVLSRSVGRRALGRPVEPPRLIRHDGRLLTEAVVSLSPGVRELIALRITRECAGFRGDVRLRKLNAIGPEYDCDGKDVLSLLMMNAWPGDRIEISVTGAETESERIARRIYGILTSRNYCVLKPDRFVIP